jgi:hypothetical protein
MTGVELSSLLFVADLGHDLSFQRWFLQKVGQILAKNELTLRPFAVTTPNTVTVIFNCFISSMWVL